MSQSFVELGSIAKFINGAAFKPEDWGESGLRIIRIQNLTDLNKPFNRTERIVSDSMKVQHGDLLVSWSATLGVYEWNDSNEALLNQHIFRVLPDELKVDKRYLRHGLEGAIIDMQQHLHGATMQHVNRGEFLKTKLYLPPIDQQKRIAAILDKAEELRRLRRQSIEHLDVLSRSIFIEMFGSSSAPKGEWNIVDFGNLIEILTDYHANGSYEILRDNVVLRKQSDYALMVRTTDLENNNFEGDCIYIDEKAYNFLSKSKVYGGEIIINKIGSAGKVYLMPHLQKPVSLGMNAFLIRLNSKANLLFIYYFLTSSYGKAAIDKNVKGAVTKTITKEAIRGIKTPVPPLSLQQEFAQRIETIESLKAQHRESLTHLDTLFASLQHRAFRGEL